MKVYVTKLTFPDNFPPMFIVFDEKNWNLVKLAGSPKNSNAECLAIYGEQLLSSETKKKGWQVVETKVVNSDKSPQELLKRVTCV